MPWCTGAGSHVGQAIETQKIVKKPANAEEPRQRHSIDATVKWSFLMGHVTQSIRYQRVLVVNKAGSSVPLTIAHKKDPLLTEADPGFSERGGLPHY